MSSSSTPGTPGPPSRVTASTDTSVGAPDDEGRMTELESSLADLAGILNATHGAIVDLVATVIEEGLWEQQWGVHSPAQWLAWRAGMSPARAKGIVAIAERRAELPVAVAALAAGELSVDQARIVAKYTPVGYDTSVTELAEQLTVTQLARNLPDYCFDPTADDPSTGPRASDEPDDSAGAEFSDGSAGADGANGPEGAGPEHAGGTDTPPPGDDGSFEGRLSWWWDDDGRGHLAAVLPTDEAMTLTAALHAARSDLLAQRRAELPSGAALPWIADTEVLLHLAGSYLANGRGANPGSDRFTIYAHLQCGADGRLATSAHLGPSLPESLARLVTCDGDIRPVHEVDGRPLSVGRTQRIVPDRTRRLIEHRDGGCIVPGCHRTTALDVHHIVHWEHGGPTDTHNLCCLCRRHHRQHHLGILAITGNADEPDGLTPADRYGRPLNHGPAPNPVPPGVPPARAAARHGIDAARYEHGSGQRLDRWSVHLRPDPPASPPVGETTTSRADRAGRAPPLADTG